MKVLGGTTMGAGEAHSPKAVHRCVTGALMRSMIPDTHCSVFDEKLLFSSSESDATKGMVVSEVVAAIVRKRTVSMSHPPPPKHSCLRRYCGEGPA